VPDRERRVVECLSAAGSCTYTLTVRNEGGAVVAERSAVLTISP